MYKIYKQIRGIIMSDVIIDFTEKNLKPPKN